MSAGPIPTGNTFDKYGSRNPVVRRLMTNFQRDLFDLLTIAAPTSVLDVGCGEGVLTARIAARPGVREIVGVDLEDPGLAAHWDAHSAADNLRFATMSAEHLDFADGAFELVCATEVLEHVADPDAVLGEMIRVSRRWLVLSVPREPLWRILNLARGAYVASLGNTPGHVQHWSAKGFDRLLARHGEIVAVHAPGAWTMRLLRVDG